ncbi:MAG: hypothetical protein IIC73_07405 [Armatimonadetes bacterium]|nr:hypothetical protein [Armatimonadota bacterium]
MWVPLAMFAGFLVLFFTMPEILDEPFKVAKFREIPYAWLLVPCTLQLFLCSLGLRVYEWFEFDDDERRTFLRRIALLAVVVLFSWYGGFLLAASFSWDYDTAFWISIAPPTVLALLWFIKKPRRQLWD